MRFMVLVKATKASEAGVLPDTRGLTEMGAFNEELVKAGVLLAGEGLMASAKGARVRFEGKQRTAIDGPFAEAKELVAGYWLWQVKSKQEAIEWAKRAPFTEGEVELRQVFEAADFAPKRPDRRALDGDLRPQEATRKDTTMKFMVLVKTTKEADATGALPEAKGLAEMGAFNEALLKAGVMVAAEGLQASAKGARVRFEGTRRTVIDGPFAEAKELVAGYWLWEVKSKQEAIEWLKRAPFSDGEVELRQLFEAADFPPGDPFGDRLKKRDEALRQQAQQAPAR